MEAVVFSDTPGHVIDVPPRVVEKAANIIWQLLESTRHKGRLRSLGNISRQPLNLKSCISAYLKDSSSTVWTKRTLASMPVDPVPTLRDCDRSRQSDLRPATISGCEKSGPGSDWGELGRGDA